MSTPGNPSAPCVNKAFLARFRIHAPSGVRIAKVFLDGKVIKRSSRRNFSVMVNVRSVKRGGNRLRLKATDNNGNTDSDTRRFKRCARAAPAVSLPSFTG